MSVTEAMRGTVNTDVDHMCVHVIQLNGDEESQYTSKHMNDDCVM